MITAHSIAFGTLLSPIGCACLRRYHIVFATRVTEKRGHWTLIDLVKLPYQCLLLIRNHAMWSVVEIV